MGISRKLFLALALGLYIALVSVLIHLHFNSDAQEKRNIGTLQIITKSERRWMKPDQLKSVIINFYNFQIEISPAQALKVQNKSNTILKMLPTAVSYEDNKCLISFSHNPDFILTASEKNKETLELTLESNPDNTFTNFSVFYSFPREEIIYAPTMPIVFLPKKNRHFYMSAENHFDQNKKQLLISSQSCEIAMKKTEEEKTDIFTDWIDQNIDFISDSDYNRLVTRFINTSSNSGNAPVIKNTEENWTLENDLDILALLSESIQKGQIAEKLIDYKQKIKEAADYRTENVNFRKASAYFGNLEKHLAHNTAEDKKLADQIDHLIKTKNPELLDTAYLFNYLLNHGNISIIDEILTNIVIPYDPANYNAEATVNLFYLYHDIARILPEKAQFFQNTDKWIDAIIQRNSYITGNKLFLIDSGASTTNNLLNIKAGSLLISEGSSLNIPVYKEIGKALISSVLGLKNIFGYIPLNYNIVMPTKSPKEKLSWGEIYYYLQNNLIWPKEQSMYPYFNPGTYIFSLSKLEKVDAQESIIIQLDNRVKTEQFILIQGITNIQRLKINNQILPRIEWYQVAYEGWNYDTSLQSIYIKTRSAEEKLVLELLYDQAETLLTNENNQADKEAE